MLFNSSAALCVISYDTLTPGDTDVVFSDNETITYTPVVFVSPAADNTYSLILPEDPATINNLIAWNDLNSDDLYDLGTEAAYFSVKIIGGENCTVKSFSYIEEVQVITYIVNYFYFDSDLEIFFYLDDNFDVIGAGGFDFYLD